MTSQVELAKLALHHLGDRYDIADLNEASVEAETASLVFEPVRDFTLRSHPWSFAKKYQTLALLDGDAPGGWDYMYAYPADCLKIRRLRNPYSDSPLERFKFEVALNDSNVKCVLTDIEDAEVVYTRLVTDVASWDSMFQLAFSYALASRMTMALTGDKELAKDLINMMYTEMGSAEEEDTDEAPQEVYPEASWIAARS